MILVKKLKFFHVLCLSKTDREKVFADVLDKKKKPFRTTRTPVYEKRKIRIFFIGVGPSFWSRILDFFNFYFYAK